MISKKQISKRTQTKKNPEIVETIILAKKNDHLDLAKKLSGPSRFYKKINLDEIESEESNKVLVVGKVLGSGKINKKLEISALNFSESAKEKLEKAGCKIKKIKEEIKDNNKLEGVKIIG